MAPRTPAARRAEGARSAASPRGRSGHPARGPSAPRQAARRAAWGHGGSGGSARRGALVGGAAQPGRERGGHGECGPRGTQGLPSAGWERLRAQTRSSHAGVPARGWLRLGDICEFEASRGSVVGPASNKTKQNTQAVSAVVFELAHRRQCRGKKSKCEDDDGPWPFCVLQAVLGWLPK